ncbi:MAG: hypothetical protein ACLQLG_08845 [Thermoguttaceae bacterium]
MDHGSLECVEICVRAPENLRQALRELARQRGVSMNALLANLAMRTCVAAGLLTPAGALTFEPIVRPGRSVGWPHLRTEEDQAGRTEPK